MVASRGAPTNAWHDMLMLRRTILVVARRVRLVLRYVSSAERHQRE
jgi:hypothetical protein